MCMLCDVSLLGAGEYLMLIKVAFVSDIDGHHDINHGDNIIIITVSNNNEEDDDKNNNNNSNNNIKITMTMANAITSAIIATSICVFVERK